MAILQSFVNITSTAAAARQSPATDTGRVRWPGNRAIGGNGQSQSPMETVVGGSSGVSGGRGSVRGL